MYYYVIVKHDNDIMNMIMIKNCSKCFDFYPLKSVKCMYF